jgi:pimeloyl-ACP methyl ester carboxylesterase
MPRRSLPLLLLVLLPGLIQAEDQFFDSNGVKIHYAVTGQGDPVLLIHGFTMDGKRQWGDTGIVEALAKDYRVITLDCRGHGKSGKPHDPEKYGLQMAEDAVRLLDHLKIQKAHVAGYSMGAFVTLKLVTAHPDRVLTATLGGAGWSTEQDDAFRIKLAESLEEGKGLGPLVERLTPAGRPKPTEEQIRVINQMLLSVNDAKALAAVLRGWKTLRVPEADLRKNQVPTLALIGELDPLKVGVDALKGRMPNITIEVISDADHITAIRRPEFLAGLKQFLAKHRLKKAA